MAADAKFTKKKLLSMRTQLRILLYICLAIVFLFILLFLLSNTAAYRSRLSTPVYNAEPETQRAYETLGSGSATRLTRSDDTAQKVKLAFTGINSADVLYTILDELDRYNIKAVFYVSGVEAAESEDFIRELIQRGHTFGSRGLHGERRLETLSQESLIASLCESNAIMRDLIGTTPTSFKSYNTDYTDAVLKTLYACGFTEAVDTPYNLDMLSFSSFSSVQSYINSRSLGDIVSMNLTEELVAPEPTPRAEAVPAVDKQGASAPPEFEETVSDADQVDMEALSSKEKILLISEWLIRANAEADYLPETVALREENGGTRAEVQQWIATTQEAACYLFSGVGSDTELTALLDALDTLGAHATFALTEEQALAYPEQTTRILSCGHIVIPRVMLQKNNDFYSVSARLLTIENTLQQRFHTTPSACAVIFGSVTDAAQEAAAATGHALINVQGNIVQEAHANERDADAVMALLYGDRLQKLSLMRGQIVHFSRGVYTDETMLSRVVTAIHTHNTYGAETINAVETNASCRYTYPVPRDKWLPGIADIGKGHIPDKNEYMDYIRRFYVGSNSAKTVERLPGFTEEERDALDKAGYIRTDGRVLFLTFDDWGSDAAVTRLLDVLAKHDVRATFFVVTTNVERNPNLLRAIAQAGHDIGSHTNAHMRLAADPDGDLSFDALSEKEIGELQDDVETSWYKLADAAGDMQNDGKPALVKMFRPPTLAVSRDSLGSIFDLGFQYVVSGSYSTDDYADTDVMHLYRDIRENLQPGAIIVLHMLDSAICTPDAIDMLLTWNEKQSTSRQYTFLPLSAYLDGTYYVNDPGE